MKYCAELIRKMATTLDPPFSIFSFFNKQKLTKTKVSGFFARGRSVEVAVSLLQNGANINARFLIHGGQ